MPKNSIYGDTVFVAFCKIPCDPTNTDTSTTSTPTTSTFTASTATTSTSTTSTFTASTSTTSKNTPNKKLVGYMDRLNEILKNLTTTYDKKVALERIALLKAEANITFRKIK
jgi:hypothetical protein